MSSTPSMNDRPIRQVEPAGNLFDRGSGPRKTPKAPKPERVKRTFHLDKDKVLLLEKLQVRRLEETGNKPELSTLVGEAIAMLHDAGKRT